mgnify:CR=1 FL=1
MLRHKQKTITSLTTETTQEMPGFFQPSAYFLVSGVGEGSYPLVAFDSALLRAGIGDVNLVRVSSIVAPGIPEITPQSLTAGTLVGIAYARAVSETTGERIAAAVAIAHPEDDSRASVIMECSGVGSAKDIEILAIAMANEAMTNRGLTVRSVEVTSSEHIVEQAGCAIAAVVLM